MGRYYLLIVLLGLIFFIVFISAYIKYYKRCPPGHILIIYNNKPDSFGNMTKIITSGGAFIWPIIGSCQLFSLAPYTIEFKMQDLQTADQKKLSFESKFIVAISTSETVIQYAIERISGLAPEKIKQLATDIILGQVRLEIAKTIASEIEELTKLNQKISKAIGGELSEIGLKLINVDIKSAELH